MKAQKIWANFSVKDAKRTKEFYTQLGCKPWGTNSDPKLASFAFGENEFVIHFFQRGSQIDQYISSGSNTGNEIIFTLSAETEQEIQEWVKNVKAAGGTVFQHAGRDETGYFSFGFADPDGHRFNVLLMEKGM